MMNLRPTKRHPRFNDENEDPSFVSNVLIESDRVDQLVSPSQCTSWKPEFAPLFDSYLPNETVCNFVSHRLWRRFSDFVYEG